MYTELFTDFMLINCSNKLLTDYLLMEIRKTVKILQTGRKKTATIAFCQNYLTLPKNKEPGSRKLSDIHPQPAFSITLPLTTRFPLFQLYPFTHASCRHKTSCSVVTRVAQ